MFQWKKLGKIYDPTVDKERPFWRWEYAQGQYSLEFDNYLRVYFCTREKKDNFNQTVSRVSYIDLDKNDLFNILKINDKPIFELGELGSFDQFGSYPFCPVRIEDKIFGYYGGIVRCESIHSNSAIGLVISDSRGEKFERIGKGPLLAYTLHEPFNVGSPKVKKFNDLYYMTYSAGRKWIKTSFGTEICYKMRLANSKDGINWTKFNKDIIEDTCIDESQASGDIIFKNNKFHMFFCFRGNLDFRHNKENSYKIGYAWSYNLHEWVRDDRSAGIKTSDDKNDFDNEMIAYPHIFELNNKIYMLYLGNEVGRYGFGLAVLEGELM